MLLSFSRAISDPQWFIWYC